MTMNNPNKLDLDLDALIGEIKNDSIRKFTYDMVGLASKGWERPASLRHHMLDEREEYGNLLHSIRVASICEMISSCVTVTAGTLYRDSKIWPHSILRDILLSASILHDECRHGHDGTAETSLPNHPQLVRDFAIAHGQTCEYFDQIMTVVESHMGKWTEPTPVPLQIDICTALHLADVIDARWAEIMPSGNEVSTFD